MEKIKDESIKEFQKYIDLLNHDVISKKSFYYFLYNDLFEINKNDIIDIDISSIINNPEYILIQNIDDIIYKIKQNDTDNLLFNELRKKIIIDKKNIESKIKECIDHNEIIKKIYIDTSIKKHFAIKNNTKFIFNNKKVLYMPDFPENNLILGNFFAKNIFIQLSLTDNIINTNNYLINLYDNFYSDEKISSYIDNTFKNIKNFNEIDMNFKYWIIILIIIDNIFSKQSNFDVVFNKVEFKNYIKKILNIEVKKDENKEEKKKGKKEQNTFHRGGRDQSLNALLRNAMKGTKKKSEKKKDSKNELVKKYERLFNITFDTQTKNLNTIYVKSFNKNLIKYFINKIEGDLPIANKTRYAITLPFRKGDVQKSLSTIINLDEKKKFINVPNKNSLFDENNMKFDIFNFLHVFLNSDNEAEINEFITKINYKLILLLYYLYDLKKKLYIKYIEIINYNFNIKNTSKNTSTSNNTLENTSKNKLNINKLNTKNNILITKPNNNFNKLKKKIEIIKNKKNIENSDEQILQLEDQYRQLVIKKYMNKYTNINSNTNSNK